MNRLITLLIIVLSMVAALGAVGASAASAETLGVLCTSVPSFHECEARYAKGTEVTATSTGPLKILTPEGLTWNQCSSSSIHFIYNGESGLAYKSASFSGCTKATSDATSGELVLRWKEGTDNATTNAAGTSFFEINTGKPEVYRLTNEGIGTELVAGASPKLTYNKAPLVGVSGSTYSTLTLQGEYSLSPTPIYVEKEPTVGNLCRTAPISGFCESRYDAGTVFTATSLPGNQVTVRGPFGISMTTCESATIRLEYNGLDKLSYAGSTWSGCTHPTSDISAGSLRVRFREGTDQAFSGGSGQLMKVESNPTFGTTTLGFLGSGMHLIQGASPKLKLAGATMSGSSTELGAISGSISGEFNLSPTPIYVGKG